MLAPWIRKSTALPVRCQDLRAPPTRRLCPALRQVEFTVTEDADLQAFRQQFKADGLPVLRVGSKTMTGFNSQEWLSYLKAAGYPGDTALPSTYRQAAPRPWRGTSAGNAGRDTNTPREQAPDSAPSVAPPPGIRF